MKNQETFWKVGHLPTLISAFLYFDVSFMVLVLLGALGNYVASDLGLGPGQRGLMTAIPLLGGSILWLVFQLVLQRYGRRVGLATGILGAAGGLGGFLLPTLVGWLKQVTGSYASGLGALAASAVVALVTLAVVQGDWIGVWIAKHGCVKTAEPVPPIEGAAAA